MRSAADEARAANLDVYVAPATVTSYVADPYHAVRRQVAAELLHAALGAAPTPQGALLEIGSGAESLIAEVHADRPRFTADIAIEALRGAKGNRVCFDATRSVPFRDASLAGVILGELIEHVFDPKRLVEEFHRVLRPGGVLILTTPNLAPLQDRLRFLVGQSPRQVDAMHPYLYLHIRPFTASSLRRMLETSGFELLALRSNFVGWRWPGGRWWESRWLAKVLPSLGGSLIVAARKR